MDSTVTSKGHVTLPKKIREFLNVKTSDKIVFTPIEDGKVLLTIKQVPASALFGMLKHRRPTRPVSLKKMDSAIHKRRSEE